MEWTLLVGGTVLLLPGALALGTALALRRRLDEAATTPAARVALGSWVVSAVAIEGGAWLGAYTYVVTVGGMAPVALGRDFWTANWLAVNRAAGWLLVGGLGLYVLGFVILGLAGLESNE